MNLEHEVASFEYVIWSNECLEWEDWVEVFEEDYSDASDDKKFELMNEVNNEYLEEERYLMYRDVGAPILVIADLGLWDGRHPGYKIIESGCLKDCMYSELDGVTWYVDGKGDFRMDGHHHDGHNYYLYRKFKDGISEDVKDEFLEKILKRTMTDEDLNRVTERLGDILEKLYGFTLPENYEKKYARRSER